MKPETEKKFNEVAEKYPSLTALIATAMEMGISMVEVYYFLPKKARMEIMEDMQAGGYDELKSIMIQVERENKEDNKDDIVEHKIDDFIQNLLDRE